MRNKYITYLIPVLIIICVFLVRGISDNPTIFTQDFNQIVTMNINYKVPNESSENSQGKMESKSYSMEKDKEFVTKIYGSIVNTKFTTYSNPDEYERQSGEPVFTIEMIYKDGKKDLIKSTNDGNKFYRIYDDKGSWIGGESKELLDLIKK